MPKVLQIAAMNVLLLVLSSPRLFGQVPGVGTRSEPRLGCRQHPWGQFSPGTWARLRVESETFEKNETLRSVSELFTTLRSIDESGVTLQLQMHVEVGGKEFETEPQVVRQGFHGEPLDQPIKLTHLGQGQVTFLSRSVPCWIDQLEIEGPATRTIIKIYYSDSIEPYLLRRESVTTDLEGKRKLAEATSEVVDVSCRLLGPARTRYHVKTVERRGQSTTTTLAVTSLSIPGAVLSQVTSEVDGSGRLVQRSTLTLVEYGYQNEVESGGLFRRRRARSLRNRNSYQPEPARQSQSTSVGDACF